MTWTTPKPGQPYLENKSMQLSVRVCLEDLRCIDACKCGRPDKKGQYWFDVPALFFFERGLQAALADPSLIAAVHLERKKTIPTSIRITCRQFWQMKTLGLRPRETIEIGICQTRSRLPAPQ